MAQVTVWQRRSALLLIGALAMIASACTETAADTAVAAADLSTAAPTSEPSPAVDDDPTVTRTPLGDPNVTDAPTAVATTEPLVVEPSPTPFTRPGAPNGRVGPTVATTPVALAAQVEQAERVLQAVDSSAADLADAGHLHQVAIRKLGYEPDWDIEFFEALPSEVRAQTLLHVSARRSLIDLSSGYDAADFIPAWEIVEPEPADALLSYYRAAEDATGIEWEYLAAINLVETGMGRIRGLSSAGAQGPMQFLPTTWDEPGIGEGDINSPDDAINAAARYLVRRGGPADMAGAIWGYNNSDDYVTAIRAYAELLRQDPAAYTAIYNWEIYFFTEAGDIWLPTGFRTEEVIDLTDYLAANPWSAPDPGIR